MDVLVIDFPAAAPQFGCDPPPAVTGELESRSRAEIQKIEVGIVLNWPGGALAIEAGAAHLRRFAHGEHRHGFLPLGFLFELLINGVV
jgi:hypothetical protein